MSNMRTMTHNSRTNAAGKVHGRKHNDRNFDIEKADNIDAEKSKQNVYFNCYNDPSLTFEEVELRFYEEHFSKQLQATNDNYIKNRHPERCKTMAEWMKVRQNAPEETTFQIGKMEKHVDARILAECYDDYIAYLNKWNEEHGYPFTVLDEALHVDEAVPHIQVRRVWHYKDENGDLRIGQEKALEAAGVELPDPSKEVGKKNHRKKTFDAMMREKWLDICEEHGVEVERVAVPNGKHNRDKEKMIQDKYEEMIQETAILRTERDEIVKELGNLEQRVEVLTKKKIEVPKLEISDDRVKFVAWCMSHIEGVFRAVEEFCKKKYRELVESRQKPILDEIESVQKAAANLDERISFLTAAKEFREKQERLYGTPEPPRNKDDGPSLG